MDEFDEREGAGDILNPEVFMALDTFHNRRHGLYDFLSEAYTGMYTADEYFDSTLAQIEGATEAFVEASVAFCRATTDMDVIKGSLLNLWVQDESDRVDMLIKLTNDTKKLTMSEVGNINEILDDVLEHHIAGDQAEFRRLMANWFKMHLQTDVHIYSGILHDAKKFSPNDPEGERFEEELVATLIYDMDEFADQYSPKYKKGRQDGFVLEHSESLKGNRITIGHSFGIRRDGEPGEIPDRTYDMTASIRYVCPDFLSFPEHVRDRVLAEVVDSIHELEEENTSIAVEFEQAVRITSDGFFEFTPRLYICIDEEKLLIPPTELQLIERYIEPDETDEEGMANDDVDDELFSSILSPDEEAEMDEIADDFLASILDPDELARMDEIADEAEEHGSAAILKKVYRLAEQVLYKTKVGEIMVAQEILDQVSKEVKRHERRQMQKEKK